MPKKPTEPFGVIEFGKDGSVRKLPGSLSNVKSYQEAEIGQSFAKGLALVKDEIFDVKMCQENDHDFELTAKNQTIIVQATEIVSREYHEELYKERNLVERFFRKHKNHRRIF